MVKNLFKHEAKAWLRIMSVIFGITLAIAAIFRIVQFFENDSIYYSVIVGSAAFMFVTSLLVCLAAPTVFGITRFYRNLFTGEGYLTLTLPVTPANHLVVKVTTSVAFSLLSVFVCIVSFTLATAGEVFAEICKAADYLIKLIPEEISGHMAGYCIEALFLFVFAIFAEFLFFDACICIGQLFRKNRALAAVGVYFGFYVISQIFSTIVSIYIAVLEEQGKLESVYAFFQKYPCEAVHIMFCGSLILSAVLSCIYYLICHGIIRNKLNLE